MIGTRQGKLTVTAERPPARHWLPPRWEVTCDCGATFEVNGSKLCTLVSCATCSENFAGTLIGTVQVLGRWKKRRVDISRYHEWVCLCTTHERPLRVSSPNLVRHEIATRKRRKGKPQPCLCDQPGRRRPVIALEGAYLSVEEFTHLIGRGVPRGHGLGGMPAVVRWWGTHNIHDDPLVLAGTVRRRR